MSLSDVVRRLLRASPSIVARAEQAERADASVDERTAAEMARLRDEVRRLQAVVESAVVLFAQEHASASSSIEKRLVSAMEAANVRTLGERAEPSVTRTSAYRGAMPIDANACARCGKPLDDDSSAFVANVGSVCTACYRPSDR
jgi:hypothetical protein